MLEKQVLLTSWIREPIDCIFFCCITRHSMLLHCPDCSACSCLLVCQIDELADVKKEATEKADALARRYREADEDNKRLREENERLKEELRFLRNQVGSCVAQHAMAIGSRSNVVGWVDNHD